MKTRAAIALTIAGSDSGGGAGVQADIKTFSALGVYGTSVITALTAQNTQGVQGIFDVPASFVELQIESIFNDLVPQSVKLGMLSRADIILSVAKCLTYFKAKNIVFDPVMVATSGDALLQADAVKSLKSALFPLAAIITPNLQEAAVLLNEPIAVSEQDMEQQALRLVDMGARAVLIKGGHLEGAYGTGKESVDILVINGQIQRLSSLRIKTHNTHGTGCTLSSAIAAYLSQGFDLSEAVRHAKTYVTGAIRAADSLCIGHGNGPTHHFFKWWK